MNPLQFKTLIERSITTTHFHQLLSLIIKTGCDNHPYLVPLFILSSSSISLPFARSYFDDLHYTPPLFAWNTLIRAYSSSKTPVQSIKLFSEMHRIGLKPDKFTYPFVVKACGECSLVEEGCAVHSLIVKTGFDSDSYVGNTLLKMYASSGFVEFSKKVFDEMPQRNVVTWSSMIAAYVTCNGPLEAYRVFRLMLDANEKPNSVTLVSLLSGCSRLLDIMTGKSIHCYILVNGMKMDVSLGTALLEMYSKCGHVEKAFQIFNSTSERNLQSWTIMISSFSDHGRGKEAISIFTEMEKLGIKPDSILFSVILSACCHMGLVDEGQEYFKRMVREYGIKPTMEHYGCMVDLFGRAGLIDKAYSVIKNMPMDPNPIILRSFLGACKNHGQVVCLDDQLKKLLSLEPDLGANYVLAASLSSSREGAEDLIYTMKQKGVKKVPGSSWLKSNVKFAD
ncbi:hypothetical protein ACFE04_005368 [Oxalis oulophora]